jgi:2-polyprenyl-3-methyl-5-hydroxy-6-metoxy-1,4-benzoquinol methylase
MVRKGFPMNNDRLEKDTRLQETRQYWDQAAATFDDEPDHGLRDPAILDAWTRLMQTWLPAAPSTILDVGCGTGSLSLVLAGLGHTVSGIDLSPAMLQHATAKAAARGLHVDFQVMDAARPDLDPLKFDVLVCRHLLWALPEPDQVLQRWANLLRPKGRMILVEGFWHTGAGLHASDVQKLLPAACRNSSTQNLSTHPELWGENVSDERYAIITLM